MKLIAILLISIMIIAIVSIASITASNDEPVELSPTNINKSDAINPDEFLKEFNYGRVSVLDDGTILREFTIIAEDVTVEIASNIYFDAWTYNGTIPGPTIRVTEGDLVRIIFINNGSHPHTIHFHGKHSAEMDGVFEIVNSGGMFVYEFIAAPAGLHLYHCHVQPVSEHINRGLYGVFIIDPKEPLKPANEMVMLMNGYDTDFDKENNFYTVNGLPFYYIDNPIEIKKGELVRIYLVNMLEFDLVNNFHLHGDLYKLYRTGTNMSYYEFTDMVTMSQGERAILEFKYDYKGMYMFHAHSTEFTDKGWIGFFRVI